MDFPAPLIEGRLIRRYKRFLSDIEMPDGREIVAHCANPGSMMGLATPGSVAWLSAATNPKRKLQFSWELVESAGALVGINTGRANAVVAEALEAGAIEAFQGYGPLRREVPYGSNSRIDFLLPGGEAPDCYIEVKSVTLSRRDGLAEFPDSVTARGAKHLAELGKVAQEGQRAVMLFLVQRGDCDAVSVAADIDPAYAAALRQALVKGVEVLCYSCKVTPDAVTLDAALPLRL